MKLISLFIITALLPSALSAVISISVSPSPLLPDPRTLSSSTTATLSTLSATHSTPLNIDNKFVFRNVSVGSYLLDISSPSHDFAPLRVDVLLNGMRDDGSRWEGEGVEAWGTFRGNEWDNKGEVVLVAELSGRNGRELVWELSVSARNPREYYMPRNGFSPLSILKNPMILIAGFSMLIIFGLPYLMDNMDPELKAEFEKTQANGGLAGMVTGAAQGNGGPAGFDAAAWLAGSGSKKEDEKGVSR